jgi:hypothetical protein
MMKDNDLSSTVGGAGIKEFEGMRMAMATAGIAYEYHFFFNDSYILNLGAWGGNGIVKLNKEQAHALVKLNSNFDLDDDDRAAIFDLKRKCKIDFAEVESRKQKFGGKVFF